MTVQWSTTVRNGLLDAWENLIGTSAKLRIYAGTLPANCAAALGGATLLAEFALGSNWADDASGGSKVLSGLPLATNGDAGAGTGTAATFYRIYNSAGSTCHEQGTVTGTSGGGDLTLDNVSVASGQTVAITAFTKTAPG